MLSVRTCASSASLITWLAGNGIHVPAYGHEAQLTLALVLYNELYVLTRTRRLGVLTIITHSLLGLRSEWAGYLESLPQKTVRIGLFWGYKYSDDDVPEREAIDWKGNQELRQLFVNPETGVERLASLLDFDASPSIIDCQNSAVRNLFVLRESRGTVSITFIGGGGGFERIPSRIFFGDLAFISRRCLPWVKYGSHRGQVSVGPVLLDGWWQWVIDVPAELSKLFLDACGRLSLFLVLHRLHSAEFFFFAVSITLVGTKSISR